MRLKIADLLSVRPRPLSELSEETGISVQGVLKHLRKIAETGMLKETELRGNKFLGIRKVYSLQNGKVGDYSRESLMLSHFSRQAPPDVPELVGGVEELESMAEDVLVQRQRISSLAKRVERSIADLEMSEERLEVAIQGRGIGKELELVALTLFTEPSVDEAKRILSKYLACPRPAEALAAAVKALGRG